MDVIPISLGCHRITPIKMFMCYVCHELSLPICVQVLLHGCILSEQNIDTVLEGIQRDLEKIETSVANSLLDVIPGHRDVSVDLNVASFWCCIFIAFFNCFFVCCFIL